MKCEGCGCFEKVDDLFTKVRTTNGALTLCQQCLYDINRKNPKLDELRIRSIVLRWAYLNGIQVHSDHIDDLIKQIRE